MRHRVGTTLAVLGMTLAAALVPTAASARPPGAAGAPSALTVPGDAFYPESISASATGHLFVGSITTGEVVRFRPGVWRAEPFLAPGVNIGTAGVLVDDARRVLWTCAIDLSFQTPTELRAFRLTDGSLAAAYALPDRGVCADLALVGGDVYVTDTTDPTVTPPAPGRILRLHTPARTSPVGGELSVWSADPLLTGPNGGLQINGLTYDGRRSFYSTNYSSGALIRVDRGRGGAAWPATAIPLSRPLTNPDGIRMLDRHRLLVTENPGRLSLVDLRSGAVSLVTDAVDQPTSVVRSGKNLWVTEGQVLRLQQGQDPKLPFTVRRVPLPSGGR